MGTPVTGTPQGGVFSPQLSVEDDGLKQQFSHQTIQRVNIISHELYRTTIKAPAHVFYLHFFKLKPPISSRPPRIKGVGEKIRLDAKQDLSVR